MCCHGSATEMILYNTLTHYFEKITYHTSLAILCVYVSFDAAFVK
jgi:hypothetical protein